jgi:hypothetical protein
MDAGRYQSLDKANTPLTEGSSKKAEVAVVSGEFEGVRGPITSPTEIIALRLNFEKNAKYQFSVPQGYNAFVYLLDGRAEFGGKFPVDGKNLVWFKEEGDTVSIKAEEAFRGIFLMGKPLNEPLETYGPFVMNNQTQIMQAMRDYQMGKMGILIEEFD